MNKNEESTEAVEFLLKEMKTTAIQVRNLIVGMPAQDLLGYIYARRLLQAMTDPDAAETAKQNEMIGENQFLLEYVHAALASNTEPENLKFDEAQCAELFELSRNLQQQAMLFAMATSADTKEGIFGPDTAEIEFRAKCNWVLIRGNRHQVLEEEFYRYVLAPHDEVLKDAYGVGAAEIAEGFQAISNVTRSGHADAIEELTSHFKAAQAFAAAQGKPLEDIMESWVGSNPENLITAKQAMDDMVRGGVANVSRHTKLPPTLLADLAYRRGEETDFFSTGPFEGTPFGILPARKKPLVQLGLDYYAIDPCFIRDVGYRALIYNLLQRKPDYRKTFEGRQKTMSEAAFADILAAQFSDAIILQEVYYKDPISKQWSENDAIILLDDVLFLVEAKAGAAATIASPALDFDRHARSVQDLVLKAYRQCQRFFNYLSSSDEVPLAQFVDGKYLECSRIRRSNYRVMVPVGLTVESFSPFSAYCKELQQIEPLLGKHPFVSISIDDLFVLKRFLPTSGSFAHYMEVRQAVAGMRRAHLFDELDHLGAYLKRNRFDRDIADQLNGGEVDISIWEGMSAIVNKSFKDEDWETKPFPTQDCPAEVSKLLEALDSTRSRGWLSVDSHIRNLGEEGRNNLAKTLHDLGQSLNEHPFRYFTLFGDGKPLFVWLQRHDHQIELTKVNDKASAAALATNASTVMAVLVEAGVDGTYQQAHAIVVSCPLVRTAENAHIFVDASRMSRLSRAIQPQSDFGAP